MDTPIDTFAKYSYTPSQTLPETGTPSSNPYEKFLTVPNCKYKLYLQRTAHKRRLINSTPKERIFFLWQAMGL